MHTYSILVDSASMGCQILWPFSSSLYIPTQCRNGGRSENLEGLVLMWGHNLPEYFVWDSVNRSGVRPPHCVLKLGFTWTFPGNHDATLKHYKILLVFEVPYRPWVKGQKLKLPKIGKTCLKISVLLLLHTLMESFVWNRLTWGRQGHWINTKIL